MPAVTHWRGTVSAVPSAPAITMPPTPGTNPAIRSNVRLRWFQSARFSGDTAVARRRVGALPDHHEPIGIAGREAAEAASRRPARRSRCWRRCRAPASAPPRSAKAGERRNCRTANFTSSRSSSSHWVSRISRSLFLPRSTQVRLRRREIAQAAGRDVIARRSGSIPRSTSSRRSHLEVEGDLLVHLLIERHAPQPRTEGALHRANSTFETPAENRRQVAISAASCARPATVRLYSLARRPSSDVPHSASTQPRRSMR